MSVFYHSDGAPSMHPTSRAEARQLRRPKYDSGELCGNCRATPLRHTFNDACIHCCRVKALEHYNKLAPTGTPAITVELALRLGQKQYLTADPCRKAGHVGLRQVNGGKCVGCIEDANAPSPRQVAKAAGERWYVPKEPCKNCGERAQRYVANGRCRGCDESKGTVFSLTEAERVFIRNYPTLIFSRERAIRGGLGIYRTGQPCSNNHTAYRRVVDGSCISCR